MKRKHTPRETADTEATVEGGEQEGGVIRTVYERTTPLWNKYYREVRKRIRFPRYYKRAVNW
jgi:hypothetical protein